MKNESINLTVSDLDREAQIEKLVRQIGELSDSELVQLNNIYCQETNAWDSEIYRNDEDFFNTFFEGRPQEVARAISFGEYEYQADWVKFNGYGNLETIRYMTKDDLVETPAYIAEFALNNQDAFDGFLNFEFNNGAEAE